MGRYHAKTPRPCSRSPMYPLPNIIRPKQSNLTSPGLFRTHHRVCPSCTVRTLQPAKSYCNPLAPRPSPFQFRQPVLQALSSSLTLAGHLPVWPHFLCLHHFLLTTPGLYGPQQACQTQGSQNGGVGQGGALRTLPETRILGSSFF